MKRVIALLLSVCCLMAGVPAMAKERFEPSVVRLNRVGKNIIVDNELCYVAQSEGGIAIVDVKDKINMKVITNIEENDFIWAVAKQGRIVYAVGKEKIYAYDVSDLENPKKMGEAEGATMPDKGRANISNGVLGVFGGSNAKLYDVSSSKKISLLAKLPVKGATMAGKVDGKYVYYVDSKTLRIYDISNPEVPVELSALQKDEITYTEDVIVDGNILYLASGGSTPKFNVVDITDKTAPVLLKTYDKLGQMRSVAKSGNVIYGLGSNSTFHKLDASNPEDIKVLVSGKSATHANNGLAVEGDCVYCVGQGLRVYNENYDGSMYPVPQMPDKSDLYPNVDSNEDTAADAPFADTQGHWAESAIADLYSKGYVDGVSATEFMPDATVTRAEFIAMLVKLDGKTLERYKMRFADIDADAWYSDYAETAYQRGYIPAEMLTGDLLKPQAPISREEMAAAAVRYAEENGAGKAESSGKIFADNDEISDWAKIYVYGAYDNSIINGINETEYAPKANATRAQSAQIMRNVLATINKKSETIFLVNNKYDIADNRTAEFTAEYEVNKPNNVQGEWTAPPAVFRVTDAVKKGELASFYGEGLTAESKVYFAPTTAQAVYEKPDNAVEAEVVKYDEREQMITVEVPEGVDGVTYTVYIENEYGISNPISVNTAFLDWVDRDRAVQGTVIRVLGENLDAREFGGTLATSVVLISEAGEKVYPEIVSINPFCIEIKLPADMPLGRYKAYVTNDGTRWVNAQGDKAIIEPYTWVEIIPETDPYKTGIPWADQYKWDNVLDMTKAPYNLTGEGKTDDTAAIQQAIDDAHNAGGGIVYFPEGKYLFGPIQINSDVVLMGDDMDKTELIFTRAGEDTKSTQAIGTKGDGQTVGKFGFYNLTVKLNSNPTQSHPDAYFWLGEDWGTSSRDADAKQPKYIFMKGLRLDTPMEDRTGRGLGAVILAQSHVWVEDTIMYGKKGVISNSTVSKYVYGINTRMTSSVGTYSILGDHQIWERNKVEHCHWMTEDSGNSQGMFTRGYNYLTENEIRENLINGGGQDGELMCTEPYTGGVMMYGLVTSAEGKKVYLNPYRNENGELIHDTDSAYIDWNTKRNYADGWHIVIMNGRGFGQLRTIKSFDEATQSIELYEDWDIMPDETSTFVISLMTQSMNMYNNYGYMSSKGWWMYANCYNTAVVDNFSEDCEGAFTLSQRIDVTGRIQPSYFVRMERNVSEGYSTQSGVNGIGLEASFERSKVLTDYAGIYGVTIRHNTIKGHDNPPPIARATEAPDINGIYIVYRAAQQMENAVDIIRGVICEGNHVEDMDSGIYVGSEITDKTHYTDGTIGKMSANVFLKDNTFKNVDKEITDARSEAIMVD